MESILSAPIQDLADELSQRLEGWKFEHVKTGGFYVFRELVIDEESLSFSVLYDSKVRQSCSWVRNAKKFFDGRFHPTASYDARTSELLAVLAPYFDA